MTETKNEQKIYDVKPLGDLQGVLTYSVQLVSDSCLLMAEVTVSAIVLHMTLTGPCGFRFRTFVPRRNGDVQTDLESFFEKAASLLISSIAAHATYPEVKL